MPPHIEAGMILMLILYVQFVKITAGKTQCSSITGKEKGQIDVRGSQEYLLISCSEIDMRYDCTLLTLKNNFIFP